MKLDDLISKKAWDARIPTKRELAEIGLRAPGANWWKEGNDDGDIDSSVLRWQMRDKFIAGFTFAIPCRDALEFIAGHSRNIVEIGAGTGFWASQLRRVGVDVIATDNTKPGEVSYHHTVGAHSPIVQMEASEAVVAHPDRDVLAIWPCMEDWLEKAIDQMKPGRKLFYIGESSGGCTANSGFFDKVYDSDQYKEIGSFNMVQWTYIHDEMWVYEKLEPQETRLLEPPQQG